MNPVTISILILVAIIAAWLFRRSDAARSDFSDPDKILAEAEILIAYGRTKKAQELLKKGLQRHSEHPQLTARLNELSS